MGVTTSYGGKCPSCQKSILQKGDTGILKWFSYDACPWCGFAYGTSSEKGEFTQAEIWEAIFKEFNAMTREELIKQQNYPSYIERRYSYFYPSVYTYNTHLLQHIKQLNTAS